MRVYQKRAGEQIIGEEQQRRPRRAILPHMAASFPGALRREIVACAETLGLL
jgi:hypothetical protein